MHPLRKAIKASERRRTRFHTERGQLMPPSAWMRLPRSVQARLRGVEQSTPWMVPAAVKRLDELIEPTWSVLEFGSGTSTRWYAERAGLVVSFEDDAAWHRIVLSRVQGLGADRCELRHVALGDFPSAASHFAPSTFDLVVVDCNEGAGITRRDCAAAALPAVRPGGYVVVDDSDIREFGPMLELFRGWQSERFVGVKQRPLMAVETTILRRPPDGAA